jgi:DNA-binding NarL/FixJ family response regulator
VTLNIIRAVECCYAGALRGEDWMAAILDALSALDPGHLGVFGEIFRPTRDGVLADCRVARPALPPGFVEERDRTFPPAMLAVREPVILASRRAADCGVLPEMLRLHRKFGAEDGVGVFVADPSGRTVLVSAAVVAGNPLAPRTLHQLTLFSAHLAAASRLRHMTSFGSGMRGAEAILDPAGKVLDAAIPARAPEARQSLVDAVRRMDRARGALRRTNPQEALELWNALVDGTWSLVERCEADGKRYILAHRNSPGMRDPKALTQRERSVAELAAMGHQNKFIAYELGLSASGVGGHLRSAERKLGVASPAELIRLLAPLVAGRTAPGGASSPRLEA